MNLTIILAIFMVLMVTTIKLLNGIKSVLINPEFVQELSNLGASYIELGKLAIEVLEKARKLAPESQRGNNYATALRGVGRIEESLEVVKNLKNGENSEEINHAIKAQQYRIEENMN